MNRRTWFRQFLLAVCSLPLARLALADGQRVADLSDKQAAGFLDITKGQYSAQVSGYAHLSFWRMASLPQPYWQALVRELASWCGMVVIDQADLRRLVDDVQVLVAPVRKRMAKADLDTEQQQKAGVA